MDIRSMSFMSGLSDSVQNSAPDRPKIPSEYASLRDAFDGWTPATVFEAMSGRISDGVLVEALKT